MNLTAPITYEIPEDLLQGVVGVLNEIPAGRSRPLLNALELECSRQDRARAEKAEADKRAAIEADVRASLEPKQETPAHAPV